MIEAIRREVPAYSRPLEGAFGIAVRSGVEQALEQFITMARRPGLGRAAGRDLYVWLGRAEAREGRSLEGLLAAYRVGARVAWRRLAGIGLEARLAPETLVRLAESIFAYIDELSAESAEGYAQEQAERAGETDRRRGLLIGMLVQAPPPDPAALAQAAEAARWRLPDELAIAVWPEEAGRRAVSALPAGSIAARHEGVFCAAIPDLNGPGRRGQTNSALRGTGGGVGPMVAADRASRSYELAQRALALAADGGGGRPVFADEQRLALILRAERQLLEEISRDRLGPLDDETEASRARLEATLLAWLRHDGDVSGAAEELSVHPQTVRYRLTRLRELLGDALEDPDARFELELALRSSDPAAL